MRMPFGKHCGVDIANLPDGYLHWLVHSANLFGELRTAVFREYEYRTGTYREQHRYEERSYAPPPRTGPVLTIQPAALPLACEAFELGFRALALKHHPDVGGRAEDMIRLNDLAELVRGQFRTLGVGR